LFQLFAAGVVDTGRKLTPGVVDTGSNLPPMWLILMVHLTCKYLREFSKKFKMTLMLFLGAWGKMIYEKNLKQKIL
jgi:hypothetical protein